MDNKSVEVRKDLMTKITKPVLIYYPDLLSLSADLAAVKKYIAADMPTH